MRRRSFRVELVAPLDDNPVIEQSELPYMEDNIGLSSFITLTHDGQTIPCLHVGPQYAKLRSYVDTQRSGFLAYLDYLFCMDQSTWTFVKGKLVAVKKESMRVVSMIEPITINSFICTHRFKLFPPTHTITNDGPGLYVHLNDIRVEV